MKLYYCLIFIFFYFSKLSAQEERKPLFFANVEIGASHSTYRISQNQFANVFVMNTVPSLGYFISRKWAIGVKYHYEFVKSDFISFKPLQGVGGFGRYYPFTFKSEKARKRIKLFSEVGFYSVNYKQEPQMTRVFDEFMFPTLHVSAVFQLRIFYQLHLEAGYRQIFYLTEKNQNNFTPRIALEYRFHKKKKHD